MAEVVEVEPAQPKPVKKSRYTPLQDLVIAREVTAAKAHTPPYGQTKIRFGQAAEKAMIHDAFKQDEAFKKEPLDSKACQDRYKRLQETYSELNDGNHRLSGFGGGEMGELADLLKTIREPKDDFESQKSAVRTAKRKTEEDKEHMGAGLFLAATRCKMSSSSDDSSENVGGSGEDGEKNDYDRPRKIKKRRTSQTTFVATEMDRFVLHLKDA